MHLWSLDLCLEMKLTFEFSTTLKSSLSCIQSIGHPIIKCMNFSSRGIYMTHHPKYFMNCKLMWFEEILHVLGLYWLGAMWSRFRLKEETPFLLWQTTAQTRVSRPRLHLSVVIFHNVHSWIIDAGETVKPRPGQHPTCWKWLVLASCGNQDMCFEGTNQAGKNLLARQSWKVWKKIRIKNDDVMSQNFTSDSNLTVLIDWKKMNSKRTGNICLCNLDHRCLLKLNRSHNRDANSDGRVTIPTQTEAHKFRELFNQAFPLRPPFYSSGGGEERGTGRGLDGCGGWETARQRAGRSASSIINY